jgi:hypothetical protein
MKNIRRFVMWAGLVLIIFLFMFSVLGAFIGTASAQKFFNSIPLAVYWFSFVAVLVWGILLFKRLWRVPGLFLMHAGCILILSGGMLGSDAGHKLFGGDKIPRGTMAIMEHTQDNRVTLPKKDNEEKGEVRELPFYVRLKDFRLEYYKPSYLFVREVTQEQDATLPREQKIAVRLDTSTELWDSGVKVKFLREFANFKIRIDGDKHEHWDDPGSGMTGAVEIELEYSDGRDNYPQYIFEAGPMADMYDDDEFYFVYQRQMISDYISELEIVEDGNVVAAKDIEVNHPLHYGGYHFYQNAYDNKNAAYTVLEVVSDRGLGLIYAGYIMLCVGVLWYSWLRGLKIGGSGSARK